MMERMSEEIELAAKSIGSAVGELAERSGLTGPPKEIVSFLSAYIHPRREVFAVKQLASAAEKVRRAGLPPAAIRDDILRALVEGGSLADDENMHERWANLLANACLDGKAKVSSAYPGILRDLEPVEATTLQMLVDKADPLDFLNLRVPITECKSATGIEMNGLENLARSCLIRFVRHVPTTLDSIDISMATLSGVMLTELGWSFIEAYSEPRQKDT
jgi:Abortive infection alpha